MAYQIPTQGLSLFPQQGPSALAQIAEGIQGLADAYSKGMETRQKQMDEAFSRYKAFRDAGLDHQTTVDRLSRLDTRRLKLPKGGYGADLTPAITLSQETAAKKSGLELGKLSREELEAPEKSALARKETRASIFEKQQKGRLSRKLAHSGARDVKQLQDTLKILVSEKSKSGFETNPDLDEDIAAVKAKLGELGAIPGLALKGIKAPSAFTPSGAETETVMLTGPDGKRYNIPSENVGKAKARGFK